MVNQVTTSHTTRGTATAEPEIRPRRGRFTLRRRLSTRSQSKPPGDNASRKNIFAEASKKMKLDRSAKPDRSGRQTLNPAHPNPRPVSAGSMVSKQARASAASNTPFAAQPEPQSERAVVRQNEGNAPAKSTAAHARKPNADDVEHVNKNPVKSRFRGAGLAGLNGARAPGRARELKVAALANAKSELSAVRDLEKRLGEKSISQQDLKHQNLDRLLSSDTYKTVVSLRTGIAPEDVVDDRPAIQQANGRPDGYLASLEKYARDADAVLQWSDYLNASGGKPIGEKVADLEKALATLPVADSSIFRQQIEPLLNDPSLVARRQ